MRRRRRRVRWRVRWWGCRRWARGWAARSLRHRRTRHRAALGSVGLGPLACLLVGSAAAVVEAVGVRAPLLGEGCLAAFAATAGDGHVRLGVDEEVHVVADVDVGACDGEIPRDRALGPRLGVLLLARARGVLRGGRVATISHVIPPGRQAVWLARREGEISRLAVLVGRTAVG